MDKSSQDKKPSVEGLPVDTSPYTQYKDLEDYKEQGYGTQGHQETQPGRGAAGSTDAPTAAGTDAGAKPQEKVSATEAVNSQGVP